MKKIVAALLAGILALTMLVPAFPVFAEEPDPARAGEPGTGSEPSGGSTPTYTPDIPEVASPVVNETPLTEEQIEGATVVMTYKELADVVVEMNETGGERIVKLGADLTTNGAMNIGISFPVTLSRGTLTILGEDHKIHSYDTSKTYGLLTTTGDAVLNLGAPGYEKQLKISSEYKTVYITSSNVNNRKRYCMIRVLEESTLNILCKHAVFGHLYGCGRVR